MIEFQNNIRIKRPVHVVFSFLANFENIPNWDYQVVQVNKITQGPVGVGTTYHQIGNTEQQFLKITDFQLDHKIVAKTPPGSFPQLEIRFILRSEGRNTFVQDNRKLDTGSTAVHEKFAVSKVNSAVSENLTKLKQLLENRRVTLEDGRVITL